MQTIRNTLKLSKKDLRPYQNKGITATLKAFKKGKAFLIADDTGLGKTPQALFIAARLAKPSENVLIVCPAFLKPKWGDEISKWLPGRNFNILLYSYNDIINPEIYRYLVKFKYVLAVTDEGHYLKNFESDRTQAFYGSPDNPDIGIFKKCKKVLSLTATPIPNRVGELYPFLYRGGLTKRTQDGFIKHWAGSWRETNYGLSHKGVTDADKFFKMLSPHMIRRKKAKVLPELPPGTRDIIEIPCSTKLYRTEQKLLKNALEASGYSMAQIDFLLNDPDLLNSVLQKSPSFEEYTTFKKIQGLFKTEWVVKFLTKEVLPEKKKFILFCFHRETAAYYYEKLSNTAKCVYVDGGVEKRARYEMLQEANEAEECILIATMKSVTEGLDLIGFDRAYFAEIDWAPYILEQCEGRLLRWGQKNPVFWYYLLFNRGFEHYIKEVIDDKFKTINSILDNGTNGKKLATKPKRKP